MSNIKTHIKAHVYAFSLLFMLAVPLSSQTITLTDSDIKAGPTIVGFGKNATGGRGGTVLFVTNLNDSGTGSLRAALTASGARIVVFRVGGTITLNSAIYVSNGNLTIAGETAPGDGILIKGNMVQIESSNVIIRNIRFRLGTPTSGSTVDAFSITAWGGSTVENIVVDHCSFSWGDDENFNIRGSNPTTSIVRNVSVQNCIISECGYGVLLYQNVQTTSFYQNLMALNSERSIRANYGYEDVFKFEMINNLIYGWNNAATDPSNGQKYTILNNKYKLSTEQSTANTTVISASAADSGVPDGWTYAYIDGNIIPDGYTLNASRVDPYIETTPYATSGLVDVAYEASEIEGNILSHVGASLSSRDAVDTRIINSYNAGTGTVASSGTFPTIASGTPYTDTDGDGLSDDYETANGGSISPSTRPATAVIADSRTVDQSWVTDYSTEGYTHMDIFLADLAGDWDNFDSDTPITTLKRAKIKGRAYLNGSPVRIYITE